MKFLTVAIICAIVSATSVTAQGNQGQAPVDKCVGKTEQDCKKSQGCQPGYRPIAGSDSDDAGLRGYSSGDYTGCYDPNIRNEEEYPVV
ncbi:hypothetical protein K492DRAFT_193697 [Lichtheimia hyalospora FSU 10163]|nr:hypothetical protein K492DRAFT_193697 [Lichtheimia hyalospora FSU 10163]